MQARHLFLFVFLAFLTIAPSRAGAESQNFAASSRADTEGRHDAPDPSAAAQWLDYYQNETPSASFQTIASFVQKHPDFPVMNKLRALAEKAMPSSLPDEQTLSWFSTNPPQTTFGMKMYAAALSRAGQQAKAKEEIRTWWKEAGVKPDEQKAGYQAFSNLLDGATNAKRLNVLLHKGQYTNARALASWMGTGYVALTDARIALQTGRGNVDGLVARVPTSLQNDEGLLFDRLRWRRKADFDQGAVDVLKQQPAYENLYDADDWGKERTIIARRYFENGKFQSAYVISANHKIKKGTGFAANEWFAGWLATDYLNKPMEGFQHFEKLYHNVETPISKSRAAYWAGVASERLNHPEVAIKWYREAAKYPATFYGQLSAKKAGTGGKVIRTSVAPDAYATSSLGKAARWLKSNGYKTEAGFFLTKMIDAAKTPQDYAAVAKLARDLSMQNYAIKAAQECETKTGTLMVDDAFPRVEKYMKGTDVEWALVHGLIRQESRYDAVAISSAGARGLMQLMPRTASEVARKAGLSHDVGWLTSKPAHNVSLGTKYLQKLLTKYDGNYALTLAAYNAGPARVDRWVEEFGDPRDPKVDLVNWIESIPIYETRNYVQRVLEGVNVYRQTLSSNPGRANGGITHIALQ